jgi:hypothetical protein
VSRARVTLPPILRDLCRIDAPVVVEAATVADLVRGLDERVPGLKPRLCGPDGALRPYLTLVVDGVPVGRRPGDPLPPPRGAAEIEAWFLAAVAGG